MPQNFLACDRDQELLLPPSLRDWLPEDHLAWFVLEVVDELDLSAFYGAYREDGHGRAAHDPAMMVALLVYAYAVGVRSSRAIERHCREDVAFRVITANQTPDHATIARFRVRHEDAIGGVFGQVLALCAGAGLVRLGVVAVDGTKIAAAATHHAMRSYEQIARDPRTGCGARRRRGRVAWRRARGRVAGRVAGRRGSSQAAARGQARAGRRTRGRRRTGPARPRRTPTRMPPPARAIPRTRAAPDRRTRRVA